MAHRTTSSTILAPIVIAKNDALPWQPAWRSELNSVSFSREPQNAHDLIAWVSFILSDRLYYLNGRDPDQWMDNFADAVNDTWELLGLVARTQKWVDSPTRPEPNHLVRDTGVGTCFSAYTRTYVRGRLGELLDYLQRKVASVPPQLSAPPRQSKSALLPTPPLLTDEDFALLTPSEQAILQALDGGKALTQAGLCTALSVVNIPWVRLSELRKKGFLNNVTKRGYLLTSKGQAAVDRLRGHI